MTLVTDTVITGMMMTQARVMEKGYVLTLRFKEAPSWSPAKRHSPLFCF